MIKNINKRTFLKKIVKYSIFGGLFAFASNNILKTTNMNFINEKFYSMGTEGRIQIFTPDITYGKTIIKNAIKRIHDLEILLTKFSPKSDIGIINSHPNIYNTVSDETLFILNLSKLYSHITRGYFDIGLGNFLSLSGIDSNVPLVGKTLLLNKHINDPIFHIKSNKIKLTRPHSMLDLGGIAKGYALDEAMNILIKSNIKHVAIELGGDIKLYGGTPNNGLWNVFLNNNLNILKYHTTSISSSGDKFKYIIKNNKQNIAHHIINPKTLSSKHHFTNTVVIGEKGYICDVLSTTCFCMNEKEIESIKHKFNDYNIIINK